MSTRNIGSWTHDTGTVTADLDYDASNVITSIHVVNDSDVAAHIEVEQISNGRKVDRRFEPHTDETIPLPTGAAARIEQFINPRGFFDGLNIRCQIPAP